MLEKIIRFSVRNKFIVFFFVTILIGFGLYSLTHISIGAVPDITNNQVQVITVSKNLSTQDIEQFITYPIELEMSNLPGVVEIRSVSKFGLSVVTIVFKESMGTYLPRQLIAEKLNAVKEKIPEGFGTPEMGPISTGLGEIYQYILDVKPGYENRYSPTDLRTIQDWIIKRYLSGIPGVVEINTWGGFLKQYEVAVNPSKLKSIGISISEVFEALEKNNSNAGGAYIEKNHKAYFIRGEGLMKDLDDIRNTVVTVRNGIPIKIKDIAKVGYGHAPRFGAITANGEGEKVMGQIMMLKGANSKEVIEAVHQRVQEISKILPEGLYINGFLDRSELVGKTTFTITENLVLGSLIVIFVVLLLLGNWRSGLIVASVIPLSLLFTLSMMYLLDIDANLMSLGAIDFGIIIDGAIIIVEFTAFLLVQKYLKLKELPKNEQKELKDRISVNAASKMMSSAIFGQIIILIVFIPILTLQGVEGKMFRPMAMTFSFALIGAILLGLTYVPAMTALFLKPHQLSERNISVRIMSFLKKMYQPTIDWAMENKKKVLGLAAGIFLGAIYIFTHLGAEFVPTLDEGDLVIQPVLKTGTSLSEVKRITTRMEKILLKFPEVKQVVSRIGAAEVPTDPMSMEQIDMIVTLKPRKEWKNISSKEELIEKMKEALSVFPDMELEFTQPIEMRFNELISGVRSDIAVKIYGEDMQILNEKAHQIKKAIENIEGVGDISVEKTAGLPQMLVKYDRNKLSKYGLKINDLNEIIAMGFAGKSAGNVFEGEKRFDLVVRLDSSLRKDLTNLKNLLVDTPNGNKIPLSEVAEITYTTGAAQISRDNTHRRTVVSINVRNRDLQSVVDDIRKTIDKKIKLPAGYYVTYAGQFENLQSAKKRLYIAVPVALILIFLMLYFVFKSVKNVLIIYTAIPFATVGGILLLWLRGMPFSISAGIGFIALFGIAVLNGIVLMERFKELKEEEGVLDETVIKKGALSRLRAVMLTALAAALGFFPMAFSTGAGAEVQRPLATVVIGGLVTSTLLTLVVLPVLYAMFGLKKMKLKNGMASVLLFFLFLWVPQMSRAQNGGMDLKQLEKLALENNPALQADRMMTRSKKATVRTAWEWDKTSVGVEWEKDRITEPDGMLRVWNISQEIEMPWVYTARRKWYDAEAQAAAFQAENTKRRILRDLYLNYYAYQTTYRKWLVAKRMDSLYREFARQAARKFELGESNYLEKITAEAKSQEWSLEAEKWDKNLKILLAELKKTTGTDDISIKIFEPEALHWDDFKPENHPLARQYELLYQAKKYQARAGKRSLWPSVELSYGWGSNTVFPGNYQLLSVSVKIPLFFQGKRAKIKALNFQAEEYRFRKEAVQWQLKTRHENLLNEKKLREKSWNYYQTQGKTLAQSILQTAEKSYKSGEIDYFQYIQSMENASRILMKYWDELYRYNQSQIQLRFLNL